MTDTPARAFAAHREAAEQRGREAERAEIVTWLRADFAFRVSQGRDYYLGLDDIADAIEERQHREGGE